MNKKTIIVDLLILNSFISIAQTNNIYDQPVQIKDNNGSLVANVSMDGKLTIVPGYSIDNVINILIDRIVSQHTALSKQINEQQNVINIVQSKVQETNKKIIEIAKIWNPPEPPKPEIKPEPPLEPLPQIKRSFWSRLFKGK